MGNVPQLLPQYRIEESDDDPLKSDIEIKVESIVISDPEDTCVKHLISKYLKLKSFTRWRQRTNSINPQALSVQELQGISTTVDHTSSPPLKRLRRRFLTQYARLSLFSMDRSLTSHFFYRWMKNYEERRLLETKKGTLTNIQHKKAISPPIKKMKAEYFRSSTNFNSSINFSIKTDQMRSLSEQIRLFAEKNQALENSITSKQNQLTQLQSTFRSISSENADNEKRLRELIDATNSLRKKLAEAELTFQEEVATLKAQQVLSRNEDEEHKLAAAVKREETERLAERAFLMDVKSAAESEYQRESAKLEKARGIVSKLRKMLKSETEETEKLAEERNLLLAELEGLKAKKKQSESQRQRMKESNMSKEEQAKRMLSEAQAQLEAATRRINAQEQQIKDREREVRELREDIDRTKSMAREAQKGFLSGVGKNKQ